MLLSALAFDNACLLFQAQTNFLFIAFLSIVLAGLMYLISSFLTDRANIKALFSFFSFIASLFILQVFIKHLTFSDVYLFIMSRDWLMVTTIGTVVVTIVVAVTLVYTEGMPSSAEDLLLYLGAGFIPSAAVLLLLSLTKHFTGNWLLATGVILGLAGVAHMVRLIRKVMRRRYSYDEVHEELISKSLFMTAAARVCVLLLFVLPLFFILSGPPQVFITANLVLYLLFELSVYLSHRRAARAFLRA